MAEVSFLPSANTRKRASASRKTTKCLQPVTATRIFPPRAIKYHKIHEYSRGKRQTVLLCFTTFMANSLTELSPSVLDEVFSLLQVSWHIYTSGISEQLLISVYCPHDGRWLGSGPDSSQHLKLNLFVFSMPKEFQLYGKFRSDNLEKSNRKSILS